MSVVAENQRITLETQIACVKRELKLRENTYNRLVGKGSMKRSEADLNIAQMQAVLASLHFFQANEAEFRAWFASRKQTDHANENFDEKSLADRLARCLGEAVDTPIMKVRDTLGGPQIELRLGAWLPEISERAAELLEEAGR